MVKFWGFSRDVPQKGNFSGHNRPAFVLCFRVGVLIQVVFLAFVRELI